MRWKSFVGVLYGLSILLASCSLQEEEERFIIGFSQCTAGDAWRQAMHAEMRRELSFYNDLELVIKDAEGSSQTQIDQIRALVAEGIDLLIVSPNESEPITPIIVEVFNNGIPVIIVDRRINAPYYTAYVGADNLEIGKTAGHYIADLLKYKGKILEIWGLPGSSPARDRHDGFRSVIKQYPELEVIAEVNGAWEMNIAQERLPGVLLRHPEIDLIYAHNDVMALGAYNVARSLGREEQIQFVGVDGLSGPNGGIQFVEDGILQATFLYPTGGEDAIRIAARILHNETFDKENILQTTVIDSSNVRVMKLQTDKILAQQQDIERQKAKINEQLQVYRNQRIVVFILLGSLIIALIMGGLLWYAFHEKKKINQSLRQKNEELLEQRNQTLEMARKAEAATQAKFQFFTNISHEFRTPLTLILGPVEELITDRRLTQADLQQDLGLIRKNALRLLRLVNQLMDFRKIEHGKWKLQASENNLVAFVRDIMMAYEKTAASRNIDFQLITEERHIPLWFDPQMLDKVLFNLLSNAFKFVRDRGFIHLYIERNTVDHCVVIKLEDNGRGMSPEHTRHAFDRFYQGDTYRTVGTGLGLSLSKELINLHRGEIRVQSEKGRGTTFEITLPLGREHLSPEETDTRESLVSPYETYQITLADDPDQEFTNLSYRHTSSHEHTILLIDDNPDLRTFLRNRLSRHFRVVEAADGQVGCNQAFEIIPDLIISDLALPGKDGLSIATQLKSDLRTSHIPIILLTARSSTRHKIKGMQTGADVYITKPFQYPFLLEQIRTLIRNREILRERFINELKTTEEAPPLSSQGTLDKKFINDFIALVEQNLSNPDLNVNDIAQQLNMSRVQAYRKVKALLGYSVSDYIKNVRLKKAKRLLLETDRSISEIAYEVGFSSPGYFSTAFKTKYAYSPSDFKARHISKN